MQGATGTNVTQQQARLRGGRRGVRLTCTSPASRASWQPCALLGLQQEAAPPSQHGALCALCLAQASITWRVQFAVGTAICLAVVAYRWTLLQVGDCHETNGWVPGGQQPLSPLCRPAYCRPALLPC